MKFFVISTDFDHLVITGTFKKTAKDVYGQFEIFDLLLCVGPLPHTQSRTLTEFGKGVDISSAVARNMRLSDHFCVFLDKPVFLQYPNQIILSKKCTASLILDRVD